MDENTFIGQRSTNTVHETDRSSSILLAKAYQHLMAYQPETAATRSSVHHGVTINPNASSTQEVQG